MFSKSKINDPAPQDADVSKPAPSGASSAPAPSKQSEFKASAPKAKPPASVLSSDLHVTGNMKTTGDVQVEGTVEGEIVWPPRGDKGFGFDPVFVAKGETETFGEMDPAKKHAMSHRADAFAKLKAALL